ncbi:uncharacterized protein EURHEDRAFT_414209 [Aspergillus ruber CBS 135680]|uniref:Uncharacterized protein n=1 Tax=Aspergillus ruber (strain CBS 135680) TaxID=1388766 RepID=A0A017S9U0_ASPRC|nr:uncharacterized protein EURHEDRAFT_414209 [Aspergillus ruber CBS 135680]EYE93409.1 hypothetical protein EURHEDRAFT_414209 [Aspergillus ruber CBS 135680]
MVDQKLVFVHDDVFLASHSDGRTYRSTGLTSSYLRVVKLYLNLITYKTDIAICLCKYRYSVLC